MSIFCALLPLSCTQAVYVLLQKRFIFNSPGCKSPLCNVCTCLFEEVSSLFPLSLRSLTPGKFKQYPVTVTAYSYFFGAIFMGLSTIYPAVTSQGNAFRIPMSVSQERLLHCDNCMCLTPLPSLPHLPPSPSTKHETHT